MRNVWLVLKHDAGVVLRQPSFWLLAVLMPVALIALQAFAVVGGRNAGRSAEQAAQEVQSTAPDIRLGLVDPAGMAAYLPPGLPTNLFARFSDDATAIRAVELGMVEQAVSISADYLETGQVTVYAKNFQIMSSGASGLAFGASSAWVLDYLLGYGLTGDAALQTALSNPTPGELAEMHALVPPDPGAADAELADLVSRIVPYAFYFILLMGSSYLMRSIVAEKENRTAEVLLLSLDPRQIMLGKILALSCVLLLQLAIWLGGGAVAFRSGIEMLNLGRFQFPPGFAVWAALFILLGYLLFASIMAAAGAVANNNREGGQVTWLLVIPLMPTLLFGPLLVAEPDHALVLFLSLFPFSSPSAMVTRLAVQPVPLWQLLLSLALLAGTAYAMLLLAARFFHAGNLVSQQAFDWRRFLRGWGRALPGE